MATRPRAVEVARRALCLGAWYRRGYLESGVETPTPDTRWQFAIFISNRLHETGLERDALSRREKDAMAKEPGSWSTSDIARASWSPERIGILMWAMKLLDAVNPYDRQVNERQYMRLLPVFGDVDAFVDHAVLRLDAEIDRQRSVAELWHWRARTADLQSGQAAPPGQLASIVAGVTRSAHADGQIPAPIDGDFPAFGTSYRYLTDSQRHAMRSIASERHATLNWLAGYSTDWDTVPTDT